MKLRLPSLTGWRRRRNESSRFGVSRFGHSQFSPSRFDATRATVATRRQVVARRWAVAGALLGGVLALVAFAPATWLASAVARATEHRVLLAQADGTIWSGNAVLVLTGGPGSRDAATLPGRLAWTLRLAGTALQLDLRQDCCINGTASLQIRPGLGRTEIALLPRPDWVAQWPSGLLGGLGTPWNTLQLGGAIRLSSPGMSFQQVAGRWQVQGRADIDVLNASSPLTTVDQLGSYRLSLFSNPEGQVQSVLSTTEGALQLSGEGVWAPTGMRFRGEARASEGNEEALNNLLNIIGRRSGDRSIISIG